MSSPPLVLTRPAALAVHRGHPWVYREGLARAPRDLPAGSAVELAGDDGQVIARGLQISLPHPAFGSVPGVANPIRLSASTRRGRYRRSSTSPTSRR